MNLLALALALTGFGWLSLKKPMLGLGAILLLLPTYLIRLRIFDVPTTVLELLLVVFLFSVFTSRYKHLQRIENLGMLNWAIGTFVTAGIISTLFSPEPFKALGLLKAFVMEPVLFFYAVILLIEKPKELEPAFRMLFTGATLISAFGIFQYFTGMFLPLRFWGTGEEVKRITSVFEYPNALALYLAPLFVFFAVLFIKRHPFLNRSILGWGFALQGAAILLTFSRGAWFAVATVLFFLLLERYSAKKILLLLGAAILAVALISPIRQRVLITSHDPSGFARLDLINAAVTKLTQNPILGNGLYGFRTTLAQQNFSGEILNYPHNIILNFWVELGLLGLVSFAAIIYISLKTYKKKHSLIGLAAVCFVVTVVLHGVIDVPYFKNDLSILFWFIISLLHIKS
ncbi:MAG TPA: O-antigen ligase family protein [Verrucomicrobiae bacterium]|nr:O-antigen ligase family protein [Verrucomicrobiae bacterium]